ncbi:MAG: CinA family protein [Bifidobacteriaceae bacterium]|nr:CinA family protein [Bifidobacteriaceae bacterium]
MEADGRIPASGQGAAETTETEHIRGIQTQCDALAARILTACRKRGMFICASESLTGGLLADAFVRIPGASSVFLGSAVTYAIEAKAHILGVDSTLLEQQGAVHPEVARQMAVGTVAVYSVPTSRIGRVVGLSTTGVAGPGPDGDKPAGLVYIGIAVPGPNGLRAVAEELHLEGTREEVRHLTVLHVLSSLCEALAA